MNRNVLFNLAGAIWGLVGLFLILRGAGMFEQAWREQQASQTGLTVALGASLLIGGVKGRFIFSRTARRNKERIARLPEPLKVHHVYAPGLYVLIAGMIGLGVLLRTYHEFFGGYLVVGAIYCGIGLALFISSFYYWKREEDTPARSET